MQKWCLGRQQIVLRLVDDPRSRRLIRLRGLPIFEPEAKSIAAYRNSQTELCQPMPVAHKWLF